MKILKTLIILLLIVALFSGAMYMLDWHTGPIIEANNAGAANDRLNAVMPNGKSYEDITATLNNVPANITCIYKETAGLGYVITCTAESNYSTAPMEIIIGVAADGKICGIEIESYNDSANYDFRVEDPGYLASYVGKDSALADIGTVAGSTFSSTAFKNAVSEAMGVLISNNMIEAGKKSDEQILTELIAIVAPGYTKTEEIAVSGNITKAYKSTNDTGFAYIMAEGENSYLAVVNAMGVCKVYDVEGTDVTSAHEALVSEAKAHAAANQTNLFDSFKSKIERMMAGATDIEALALDTFNTVASAVSFKVEDATYYGFYSRSIGFHQMDVYVIIDANGAIAKIDAKQFIFDEEYFMNFGGMDATEYKNGFVGLTGETFNGDAAIIATATMTSNAMKQSTEDAFAAFESITKGGVNG
jgi:uncharacterized protein with FMN-binding domain